MSNEGLKELFKFILYSKNCEDVKRKIGNITDPYILHTLAYNLEYHAIHFYKSGNLCIENAVADNPDCDLGTAVLLFYFKGGLGYLLENNIRYNKMISLINKVTANKETRFLEKIYKKILNNEFEANISYQPKIGKIELSAFEKRNVAPPEILTKKTPGMEYSPLKIWYK